MDIITKLSQKINASKEGNKESIMEIITQFKPLINKYKRKLRYEDAEQDLIEHLIITIYKMPIREDRLNIGYIARSIKNKYIQLSKKQREYRREILDCYIDNWYTVVENDYSLEINEALSNLPQKQREIILFRYYYGYSDAEISDILGISRQMINKHRKNSLTFLRNSLKTGDFYIDSRI